MKSPRKGLLSVCLAALLVLSAFPFTKTAYGDTAGTLVTRINAVSGLSAVESSPGVVTVTGAATMASATVLTLNIDSGVTVVWKASLSKGTSTAHLLDLTGGGSFVLDGGTITHTGTGIAVSAEGAGATIELINGGSIVSGATSSNNNSGLSISGADITLRVNSGSIVSNGTGHAVNISGVRATVEVNSGAIIASTRNVSGGSAIRVAADSATITVNAGGVVENPSTNSTAVIHIVSDTPNAIININGGTVRSETAGYAISDGAGVGACSNNSLITVNSGEVFAENSCAIHSSGANSQVIINGGTLTSYSGNAVTPTLYKNAGTGYGIVVNGGTVQNLGDSGQSYAIVASCDVLIDGGTVTTVNGRGISITGADSTARVLSGSVEATGTGMAITTATGAGASATARIIVEGGTVLSKTGTAINSIGASSNITVSGGTVSSDGGSAIVNSGASSSITVSGGVVSATSGSTITSSGADATVIVSGGEVSATSGNAVYLGGARTQATVSGGAVFSLTGYAIQSAGNNSAITVTDDGSGGPGGQVYVLAEKNAIQANGTVTVSGGLVFAYGDDPGEVIHASVAASITWPTGKGVVAVWDEAAGHMIYEQGTSAGLLSEPSGKVIWDKDPILRCGITYENGSTKGFFPLDGLKVVTEFGLIFDAATGKMYENLDGSGTLSSDNLDYPFTGVAGTWSGSAGYLELNNFIWDTTAPVALTIVGGDVTIHIRGNNFIASHDEQSDDTIGISAAGLSLTIEGDGFLHVEGGPASTVTSPDSYGIRCYDLTYNGGTLLVQGDTGAFDVANDFDNNVLAYVYLTNDDNSEPSGDGAIYAFGAAAPYNIPFVYDPGDKYVMLAPYTLGLIEDVRVSGTMETALTSPFQIATIHIYNKDILPGLSALDASGWFTDLPVGLIVTADPDYANDFIILTFSGTPVAGSTVVFDVTIPGSIFVDSVDLAIEPNPNAYFDIVAVYVLTVLAEEGGSVTGTPNGKYVAGTPISLTAVPDAGYRFTGWTAQRLILTRDDENPLTFLMPEARVYLTAGFELITYSLDVANGLGGGNYPPGEPITITAAPAPAGKEFDLWVITSGEAELADASNPITTITILQGNVVVTATYKDIVIVDPPTVVPPTGDDGGMTGLLAGILSLVLGAACLFVWRRQRQSL